MNLQQIKGMRGENQQRKKKKTPGIKTKNKKEIREAEGKRKGKERLYWGVYDDELATKEGCKERMEVKKIKGRK